MIETEEYAFISCLLSKPELINRVSSKIRPEYLSDELCKTIYNKMLELGNFSIPLLSKELKEKISFKSLLDIDQIIGIVTPEIIDGYGYYIVENWKQSEIKKILSSDNIDDISSRIDDLKQITYFEEEEEDESTACLTSIERRFQGIPDGRTIKTGFASVDEKIEGVKKTELIIIGARPGVGKTVLGINIAYNMAKDKKNVLFCSLEMGKVELHERLLKSITKINNYKTMSQEDFEKIVKVSRAIKERLPLTIYDKPGMTIENIIYKAKQGKYDIVVVDHLSILKSVQKFKSRYEEVSYLSSRLKVLARETNSPVICLCQLNRALEGREIKAPNMSDLRDSGSIEQDADLIFFIYRPEYHLKDKEPDDKDSDAYYKWEEEMQKVRGKACLILAKNRRGYTGRFNLRFDGTNYTFYEE